MRRKVVIAEDEPTIREALTAVLEARGWSVHPVADGEQAVLACRWTRPHLLITDNRMPDMSGAELVRRVREDDRFERIRIVMFSGNAGEGEEGLADAVVAKAEGMQALLEALDALDAGRS